MPDFVQELIDTFLRSAMTEGRRALGAEAAKVLEHTVDGLRRLLIVQYIVMSVCFLWAASFLASGWLVAAHWEQVRGRELPAELIFTVSVWVVSTLVLAFSVQRSFWVRPFARSAPKRKKKREPLTEEQVASIVERTMRAQLRDVVGEQLRSALREQAATEAGPSPLRREKAPSSDPAGDRHEG